MEGEMEDRLKYILSAVNDWLRFAENKNAAVLVADSALMFGVLTLLKDVAAPKTWIVGCVSFGVLLLSLSAVCSLVSFIPKLEIPWLSSRRKAKEDDNLLFYAHIANYEPLSYLNTLYAQCDTKPGTLLIEVNYAGQIVINSRIALKKYRCFCVGVYLTVVAVLTLVITGLVYVAGKII
jgi:Family of unknown function (DUF5706)